MQVDLGELNAAVPWSGFSAASADTLAHLPHGGTPMEDVLYMLASPLPGSTAAPMSGLVLAPPGDVEAGGHAAIEPRTLTFGDDE